MFGTELELDIKIQKQNLDKQKTRGLRPILPLAIEIKEDRECSPGK